MVAIHMLARMRASSESWAFAWSKKNEERTAKPDAGRLAAVYTRGNMEILQHALHVNIKRRESRYAKVENEAFLSTKLSRIANKHLIP